jgi:hypothetical protein
MTAQDRGLTGDQISVLEMLAWLSERLCRIGAEGQRFHDRVARRIDPRRTRDRDARVVKSGDRTLGVVRLAITEKGRTMIAR